MTKEQFDQWFYEDVPCALFHVESTDLDDVTGVRIDELKLVCMIAAEPQVLKHQTLEKLVDHFIVQHDKAQ
jgi:hypothetical protein